MNWASVQLERLAVDMQPGFACQPTTADDGVPQLRTNNVSVEGRIDLSELKHVPASVTQIERYSLIPGDILFNNTNSPALVGKTAFFCESGQFLFSNHMTRIRVDQAVAQPRYVARFLHWTWSQGALRALVTQWVNQAAINRGQLGSIQVPLPAPSEQRRIVEVLERADYLRRLRTEADAKAERILPALFIKLFGDPATNPKGWPVRPVGELGLVTTGNTPPRGRPDFYGEHIEWIKSDNINTSSHFLTKASERLSASGAEVGRIARAGSTLVTCIAGSPGCIGNAALANREVAFNQQINAVTPRPGVDAYFLYAQFVVGKKLIQGASTGGMKGLVSKGRLSEVLFLDPPAELQEMFGETCQSLCGHLESRRSQERKLAILFSVLLRRAFGGELTASWREAHSKELLEEMEQQAKTLAEVR